MLTKRVIVCLDVRNGKVTKGVRFRELRGLGMKNFGIREVRVTGIASAIITFVVAPRPRLGSSASNAPL